jgi:hypothetical protein
MLESITCCFYYTILRNEIPKSLELAYREGTAAHVVEKGLFQKLLEMGYQALGYLFALHGACDEGERVE